MPLKFEGKTLAPCPFADEHSKSESDAYPNLLTTIYLLPNGEAIVNRMIFEQLGPDGLKYYWSESPRIQGLTPAPGFFWRVICRSLRHEIPPMNIHWVGGINDGADP